jgi:hypothetical protein
MNLSLQKKQIFSKISRELNTILHYNIYIYIMNINHMKKLEIGYIVGLSC